MQAPKPHQHAKVPERGPYNLAPALPASPQLAALFEGSIGARLYEHTAMETAVQDGTCLERSDKSLLAAPMLAADSPPSPS
jgi:hypothetical protein